MSALYDIDMPALITALNQKKRKEKRKKERGKEGINLSHPVPSLVPHDRALREIGHDHSQGRRRSSGHGMPEIKHATMNFLGEGDREERREGAKGMRQKLYTLTPIHTYLSGEGEGRGC